METPSTESKNIEIRLRNPYPMPDARSGQDNVLGDAALSPRLAL